MCGIAGAFSLDGPLPPDAYAGVRAMTAALAHRGPDGDGFFDAERAALGHRRLAIIDVARGQQPLANEDGSCWIVFNGEIYNHRTLRPRLEDRGHRFRTDSDTETIVHAYEEFGPGCVEHLEGMFAFAIYDGRQRALFAARDRLGKKPFFYFMRDGVLHFASELPALREAPLWHGEIDLTALEGYLSLGYFLAPGTIYRNVRKLEPGHWLRAADGRIESREYLGRPRVRQRSPAARGAPAGDRRHPPRGGARSARERSAARRVPQRRHRFRPRRLVHGRSAR